MTANQEYIKDVRGINGSAQNSQPVAEPFAKVIYIGILLTLVLEYFNPAQYLPFIKLLKMNTIVPLSTFALWLFFSKKERISVPQNKILVALCALILFSILHTLVTSNAYFAFRQYLGYLFLYFLLIHSLKTVKRINGVIWVLVIVHLALIVLNQHILSDPSRMHSLRAGYFIGDGNDFSLSLIIMIPLTSYLLLNESIKARKFFLSVALAVFLIGIIALGSRASFLALSGMLFMFVMRSKKKMLAISVMVIFFIVVGYFASARYINRIESIRDYQTDTSAQGRIDAWKAGLQMAIDFPLGVGAGNFNSYFGRFYRDQGRTTRWISPHSMFVQSLAELGFLGFFLFISLFVVSMRKLSMQRKKILNDDTIPKDIRQLPIVVYLSLVGFIINGSFLGVFYYPHTFILMAIAVSTLIITESSLETATKNENN